MTKESAKKVESQVVGAEVKTLEIDTKTMDMMGGKPEPTPEAPKPMLDVVITDAIQAAIAAAMGQAIPAIIAQLKPAVAPAIAPMQNPNAPSAVTASHRQPHYKSKLEGIPVEPGQDLRHVPVYKINQWFLAIEERAKERLNAQRLGGQPVNVSWSRG